MYETEANFKTERLEQIPIEAIAAFSMLRKKIRMRTVLPWSEHCTECVWPTCYTTCDLYSPREDGRCRRFVDGMVRINCPDAVNGYLLKIRFKQWGKLWSPGNLNLQSFKLARETEKHDYRFATVLYQLPMPKPIKNLVANKRYGFKKRRAVHPIAKHILPTAFAMECYNPTGRVASLSLTCRSLKKGKDIPFQKLLHLDPGFNMVRIPFEEMSNTISIDCPFNIELTPNFEETEITLYFGLLEFIQETQVLSAGIKKAKCVVWDLDNTLWDGILVEDGVERLQLKEGIAEIIETLDRRGILQSVASKNNLDQAMEALKRFEIDHFFLYPQISWSPKGEALQTIARQLNIGAETLLFLDDSPFERQQVESSLPGVQTLDALLYKTLLVREECQVPITDESSNRRKMYQVESDRKNVAAISKDDYKTFLRNCEIRLTISSLTDENLERVHELAQRTNQMNFSGNRYDREVLRAILNGSYIDTYVLACEDKFGSYGIVGFGVVDTREPRMTDLMFSCRIQSKMIEHAFLGHIIRRYIGGSKKDFYANYRKTPRNEASGQVFEDLGMQGLSVDDGVTLLVFRHNQDIPDDQIVSISELNQHIFIEHKA